MKFQNEGFNRILKHLLNGASFDWGGDEIVFYQDFHICQGASKSFSDFEYWTLRNIEL